MNETRNNARSTFPKAKQTEPDTEEQYEQHLTKHTNVVYATIRELEGHTYTDLTGGFPKTSSRGYKYILVVYDYD
jgi:hypothetical protein